MSTEDIDLNVWDEWNDRGAFHNIFLLNLLTELEKKDCESKPVNTAAGP